MRGNVVVAAIVALASLLASVAIAALLTGSPTANSTPLMATLSAVVAPTIVALITLAESRRTNSTLNGSFDERVADIVRRVLAEDPPPGGRHRA